MVKTSKKTTAAASTKKAAKPAKTKRPVNSAAKAKTKPKAAAKSTVRESRTKDFMVVQFTRDTLYWLIFGVVTIVFVIWVMSLQHQINDLYDQIEVSQTSSDITEEKLRLYQAQDEKNKKD